MRYTVIIGIGAFLAGLGVGRVAFGPTVSAVQGFPLAALGAQTRFTPAVREDAVYGFKVSVLRRGNVLQDLGLKNGDVIKAIGGHPVIHSATLPLALAALEGDTTVDIDRKGEALTLACSRCAQKLRDAPSQPAPAASLMDRNPLDQPGPGSVTTLPPGAVTALGNNRYRIAGGWRRLMGNMSQLATQARVVPSFEDGEPAGFKLFAIRPGSTLSQLGLLNGDTVHAIQGRPVTDPESALEAYTSLLHEKVVTLSVKRRGAPVELTFEEGEDVDGGAAGDAGDAPAGETP